MQLSDMSRVSAFIFLSIILSTLLGCATSSYQNPANSNNINARATFRAHDSMIKSARGIVYQSWGIFSSEYCSPEPGYGDAGGLTIYGDEYKNPLMTTSQLKNFKKEFSVNLKAKQRVYIRASSIIGNVHSGSYTFLNSISFIPYENADYIIQQYFSRNKDGELQSGIKIVDRNTNNTPSSLLVHKFCK